MNRRRNALADIFDGLSPDKVEQLQHYVNTDGSRFDEDSSVDLLIDTTNPTHTLSTPLNRNIDQSNPIDISRNANLNGLFYDQITTNYLGLSNFETSSGNEETVSDDEEEDERFVQFVNSPRYLQRRLGISEHTFRENLNMLHTGVLASH